MSIARGHGQRWGMRFPQDKGVSRGIQWGNYLWVLIQTHIPEFYYHCV
jgi:hypothetical protein